MLLKSRPLYWTRAFTMWKTKIHFFIADKVDELLCLIEQLKKKIKRLCERKSFRVSYEPPILIFVLIKNCDNNILTSDKKIRILVSSAKTVIYSDFWTTVTVYGKSEEHGDSNRSQPSIYQAIMNHKEATSQIFKNCIKKKRFAFWEPEKLCL